MSKELDALNDMLEYLLTYDEFNEKRHNTMLTSLKLHLKTMKKPKKIVGSIPFEQSMENYVKNNCPSIAKKLKALKIIIKKRVNVSLFFSTDNLNSYNDYIEYCRGAGIVKEAQLLTEDEYDLLREVLEDE